MRVQGLLVVLTAAAYAVGAIGYAANFQRRERIRERTGLWGLLAGWGFHSLLLAGLTVAAGGVPLTRQVLPSVCAWLVVAVYLYIERSTGDRALGALVVPIVTLLHLLAVPNLMELAAPPELVFRGGWFQLHVLAFILAYAALTISCVSAVWSGQPAGGGSAAQALGASYPGQPEGPGFARRFVDYACKAYGGFQFPRHDHSELRH